MNLAPTGGFASLYGSAVILFYLNFNWAKNLRTNVPKVVHCTSGSYLGKLGAVTHPCLDPMNFLSFLYRLNHVTSRMSPV